MRREIGIQDTRLVDIPTNIATAEPGAGTVKFYPGENQRLDLLKFILPKDSQRLEQTPVESSVCSLPGRIQVIPPGGNRDF